MTVTVEPRVSFTAFDPARRAKNPLFTSLVQIAYVVPALEPTLDALTAQYGIPGFQIIDDPPVNEVRYRGRDIDLRITVALGYMDHLNFEVILPKAQGDDDVYSNFLKAHPEGGFHHLGFRVHDFEGASAHLERQMGPAVQSGRFGTGGTRFAYFDSRATLGGFTEIIYLDPVAEQSDAFLRAGHVAGMGG